MTDAAVRNQGASIKALEIQIGKISKVLQERGFGSLPSSIEANPRDYVKSISTNVKADSNLIRRYITSIRQLRPQSIIPDPKRERPRSFHFTPDNNSNNVCFDNALADLGASVSVMPLSTYLNLGLGELAHTKLIVELADKTMKYTKGIAKNVLVELRRDQVDDLMPTIEEVENMDGYQDQDMGDITLGEPFCKPSCVEARRFDGLITIHNGCDNVTYQMARSHPVFKHLSNAQCNKIKLLLKDLAAKKSTKLVKYRSSEIMCVL
ncbi:ATP-dependent DNA helicase PIF1-like protein [Tanacetum coccineum]